MADSDADLLEDALDQLDALDVQAERFGCLPGSLLDLDRRVYQRLIELLTVDNGSA